MYNPFKRNKADLATKVMQDLGFDLSNVDAEGYSSIALKSNPHFEKAIAELKYLLLIKEDDLTSDLTLDTETQNRLREYYSMCRVLLDSVVNMLDQKIQLAENYKVDNSDNNPGEK